MAGWAVTAWRDANGEHGITVGMVLPVGYDNHVVEVDLDRDGFWRFLADCVDAFGRSVDARAWLREPLPGPYDKWPHE